MGWLEEIEVREVLLEKEGTVRLPGGQKVFVKPEAGKRLTCSKDERETKHFRTVEWDKPGMSWAQTKGCVDLFSILKNTITDSYRHSITKTSPHVIDASVRSYTSRCVS